MRTPRSMGLVFFGGLALAIAGCGGSDANNADASCATGIADLGMSAGDMTTSGQDPFLTTAEALLLDGRPGAALQPR